MIKKRNDIDEFHSMASTIPLPTQ